MKQLPLSLFIVLSLLWSCSTQRTTTLPYTGYAPPKREEPENGTSARTGEAPDILMPRGDESDAPAAMIVGADGASRLLTGYGIGSPGAPLEFTAPETRHVKFVQTIPRTGEMLMLPLQVIRPVFRFPCDGAVLSNYGPRSGSMHTGVDLKARPGDTIRSAMDGIVRMSREYGGYGNLVVVRHACGIETLYGHNSRNLVAVNRYVRAGQAVALAGRTGRATTEHCHFEVLAAGRPFDPGLMLDFSTRTVRSDTIYIFNRGEDLLVYNARSSRGLLAAKPAPAPSPRQTRGAADAPAPNSSRAGHRPVSAPGGARIHTVVRGDILSRIAGENSVSVEQLCRWNGIGRDDILRIGQQIIVSEGANRPAPVSAAKAPAEGEGEWYTVKKGEGLYRIAVAHSTTVARLCELNGIENEDAVREGQRIRVK